VLGVEMLLQLPVALHETPERIPHGAPLHFHFTRPANEAPQRGRDQDLHGHSSSSGSKRSRSSASTQDVMLLGLPCSTLRITYEYQGHACSRSNSDGRAGWSGCEW